MSPQPHNYYGNRPNGDEGRTGQPKPRVIADAKASGATQVMWMIDDDEFHAPATPALLDKELYLSRRVRTPARYANRRHLTGYYWFSKNGDHVWHDSLNEASVLRRLDHRGDVVLVASQPLAFVFPDGKWHVLDFLALDTRGRQRAIDVKIASKLHKPAVAEQFERTAKACKSIGWAYDIATEASEQAHINLVWLAQFRHHRYRPSAKAMDALREHGATPMTILEAAMILCPDDLPTGRSYFYNLAWCREVDLDLEAPFSDMTPTWSIAK